MPDMKFFFVDFHQLCFLLNIVILSKIHKDKYSYYDKSIQHELETALVHVVRVVQKSFCYQAFGVPEQPQEHQKYTNFSGGAFPPSQTP